MTTPTEAAAEIYDIIGTIKELTARKQVLEGIIGVALDLGQLDNDLMADEKGYALGSIRCCPVRRTTYDYDAKTKNAIKALQEQSKVEGLAIEKVSISYRFSTIEGDS